MPDFLRDAVPLADGRKNGLRIGPRINNRRASIPTLGFRRLPAGQPVRRSGLRSVEDLAESPDAAPLGVGAASDSL